MICLWGDLLMVSPNLYEHLLGKSGLFHLHSPSPPPPPQWLLFIVCNIKTRSSAIKREHKTRYVSWNSVKHSRSWNVEQMFDKFHLKSLATGKWSSRSSEIALIVTLALLRHIGLCFSVNTEHKCFLRNTMLAQVLPMTRCLSVSVCLSQVGVLSKQMDGSSWFLARELPSIYPILR